MDNTLLLLSTFILLLNSSHEAEKQPDNAMKTFNANTLDEGVKQNVLNLFITAYNAYSNDTYLSNIMNNKLWLWGPAAVFGRVQLGQTTCTKIESNLDKCPFKTEFHQSQGKQGTIKYIQSHPEINECNKFLSELANCPFNEQENQKTTVSCSFVYANFTNIQLFKIVIEVKCLRV